jgi:hypothetical protein
MDNNPEMSVWLQKRKLEYRDAAEESTDREEYYRGKSDAFGEVKLVVERTKLGHDHECYWKDRYDKLQQVIEDVLGPRSDNPQALEHIKKTMESSWEW